MENWLGSFLNQITPVRESYSGALEQGALRVVRRPFDLELLSSSGRSMSGRGRLLLLLLEAMRMRAYGRIIGCIALSLLPSFLDGPIHKLTFRVPIAASESPLFTAHVHRPIVHQSPPEFITQYSLGRQVEEKVM